MSRKQHKTSDEYNLLERFIYLNDVTGLRKTISSIMDINEVDSLGHSLLWTAVARNNLAIAEKLLEAGANPNSTDKYGFPIFHLAVVKENLFMLSMLEKRGANIFSKDEYGNTALSRALFCNSIASFHIIIFLLKLGLNPNEKNNYGNSARDSAFLIANYDYKPLFMVGDVLYRDEKRFFSSFDDIAIVSEDVLAGANVFMLRYFDADRVWEIVSKAPVTGMDVRITPLHDVLQQHPYLSRIMERMEPDQEAIAHVGDWIIQNIKRPPETR